MIELTCEQERLIKNAEEDIQAIILSLWNNHNLRVSHVNVDTRNYSYSSTDIIADYKP